MKSIKLVTDSGADLSKELIERYDIKVIPIPVKLGDKNYKDGEDITPLEFYNKLKTEDLSPLTSMINPYTFEEEFKRILEEYQELVYISFSSQLSGIYNSAKMAQKVLGEDKVTVIDSKAASLGLGLIVLKAARLLEEGESTDMIISKVEETISKMKHIVAIGSLEMLKKGGRISSTQAFIGSLLNIIPMAEVDSEGKLVPLAKVRGEKRSIKYILDTFKERVELLQEELIGIGHADNSELANKIATKLKQEYSIKDIIITDIGAAVGSHAGPGTVALFFQ
ncbi:DegV family protein with EDD domain [Orenia metallireducens]|uniref:EDD domain protein, DegV family n=1 Tax=Orenia metallireducens TaxID=1413210 RepID=A0A285G8X4_9FIRM|nr:DegV family protein [Orenia metallireducens]PRX28316.1 DegV family protein with EDD domain [Orenia metallireducens]SNY18976.1 EDD domain protein, DegV family [Orenia metallireducens]